jgi:Tfp pilus assembly protein PilE
MSVRCYGFYDIFGLLTRFASPSWLGKKSEKELASASLSKAQRHQERSHVTTYDLFGMVPTFAKMTLYLAK